MASFRVGQNSTEMNMLDDDVSAIIGEYSIPNLADITSDSLLTKSQYAKVIFHDLLPCYPTDADIWCRYSLTDGITSQHGDRVALYRVGWSSVHEHVQFEVAPITNNIHDKEFQVLFKAEALPKDTTEFYQLCYVNVNDSVCGASVPFQFRHPVAEELCEVEEQGGLMVVRSRTAINGEKLRDAAKMIDDLESEKLAHEEKIQTLESAKDSLSLKLDELNAIQKQEAQLRVDVEALENEKIRAFDNLEKAGIRIQSLSATVASLSKDNSVLTELLKNETQKQATSQELAHYKLQIDNMQQMLDALTQSKEMASHALRCEQSKVMKLNIEHDKYKYRAQHLEEENKGLQMELQHSKNEIETSRLNTKELETLLQLNGMENEGASSKLQQLIRQVGQMQFDIKQLTENNDSMKLQLRQRDNQILTLDTELQEMRMKGESFDQLNEEYANLKRQLQDFDAVQATVKDLTQNIVFLCNKTQQLKREVSELRQCKEENYKLTSEFELLSVQNLALQNELYNSSVKSSVVHDLQENNASLRCRLQQIKTQETEMNRTATSIEELKYQLSAAEANNASLMHELKQIKEFQPDWNVDCPRSGSSRTSVTEALGDEVTCTTTFRAPGKNMSLQQVYQNLQESKGKLEVELQDLVTRENSFRLRTDTISRRLLEIEEDVALNTSELNTAIIKNRRDRDDLMLINNRMASVQQQLLRDDQTEGRDFHDNTDQDRLERMSKRSHDLQCSFTESTSRIHDLQQNIQVLNQERDALDEELNARQSIEKETVGDKCKLLEDLVNLDKVLITLSEKMFKKREEDLMNKSCSDFLGENLLMENAQSIEISSTDLEASVKSFVEDAIIPEARIIRVLYDSDRKDEDSVCQLVASTTSVEGSMSGEEATVNRYEPIEKAVESGVREGLKHSINTLKQQAAENLTPDSISSSTESLTNVEQKCVLADQACQEKEQLLEEKLTVVLKDTVRKELLEGMLGVDSRKGAVETIASAVGGANEVEADLKLRLELAAEEYRKIYTQKLKLEKQLAKVQKKQVASPRPRITSVQGCTVEAAGYVCPICGVSFPATQSDTFTRHFEDHLS